MTDTFTTWGGKELLWGIEVIVKYPKTIVFINKRNKQIASWDYIIWIDDDGVLEKLWTLSIDSPLPHSLISILSVAPNSDQNYIAWCHERGIEVPGGEINLDETDSASEVMWMHGYNRKSI